MNAYLESSMHIPMPDGVGPGKGWKFYIDGAYRVSHDVEKTAIAIAFTAQERNKGSRIRLRENGTDNVRVVLANRMLG